MNDPFLVVTMYHDIDHDTHSEVMINFNYVTSLERIYADPPKRPFTRCFIRDGAYMPSHTVGGFIDIRESLEDITGQISDGNE